MTFKQLVWKMAKVNKRKYIFYFLCKSFTVMVFFMFSTVFFNNEIIDNPQIQHGMNEILMIPAIALLIFTVFFISYAHSIFIKRRKKEFGLFMTLGMTNRDLIKLILIENVGIALVSIGTGILSGIVFSRLFFHILMSNVGITDIPFYLNEKMFLYTIGIFLLVLIVAIGKSLILMQITELVKILKWDRISESKPHKNPILGVVGIGIIIFSMSTLYIFTYEKKFNLDQTFFKYIYELGEGTLFILCTISLILGLYLAVSRFGSFLLKYTKKYPNIYYRRLLVFTNIDYKIKQLNSTFMLIIIMAMVTIFYSTMTLNFYSNAEYIAEELPYDVAFVQTETKNKISLDEASEIFNSNNQVILEHLLIETLDYFEYHPQWNFMYRYTFIPVESFNKISETQLHISEGQYIYLISSDTSEENRDYTKGFKFDNGEKNISLALQDMVFEPIFDYRFHYYNPDFILVNEKDYEMLRNSLDVYPAEIHWLNLTNWKQSAEAVNELKQKLHESNQLTPKIDEYPIGQISPCSEEELLDPVSKINEYNMSRIDGGIIFFVSTFLSILFFFATFILLYLNLFTDIEQERIKYRKLYKIGITKKEVKKMVTNELRILFFLAPIIGIILSAIYVITIVQDSGGIMSEPILIVNFLTIGGLYLLFQTIYYFFATRKFLKEIVS
ncbi:ABC transporter permease [Oceanobacillus luteolus]|uniref:FtsX-like permease family protein n=1 Tax=Oceanobacillus luteolus TaxID=1274358 RepID=UPI00203ECB86|nr:FtsX-like permease family protein [Oceanobacillus luteolus]MCM3739425.1 ABC transporter permease [Oceanobacillus luteolus]